MKALGSSGTFVAFTSALSLIGSRSSPSCSELGFWKMEMLVPWNDVFAVVAVGLWSMLSTTEVVNLNPTSIIKSSWVKLDWQLID